MVREKLADGFPPVALAVTVYEPAMLLAVAVTLACPLLSVVAGFGLPSVALAPLPAGCAVNVSGTPLTGTLDSVSVTSKGLANAVLTGVLCPEPLVPVSA